MLLVIVMAVDTHRLVDEIRTMEQDKRAIGQISFEFCFFDWPSLAHSQLSNDRAEKLSWKVGSNKSLKWKSAWGWTCGRVG